MTPKQQIRAERLERFANADIVQIKIEAEALGIPTRFLKVLDEMKIYAEQAKQQLTPRESAPL